MSGTVDLSSPVHDLTERYPEIIGIMAGLGFAEIANPAMRATVGRMMTIPKGCRMKGVELGRVVSALREHGFTVTGVPDEGADEGAAADLPASPGDRVGELKGYLRRLGSGEDLQAVRNDFAARFRGVSASEIMDAEQGLMGEGYPLEEVQRLCDLHSGLFHGMMAGEQGSAGGCADDCDHEGHACSGAGHAGAHPTPGSSDEVRAQELAAVTGHPVNTLTRENRAILAQVSRVRGAMGDPARTDAPEANQEQLRAEFDRLRELSVHFAKKGDLIFPVLAKSHGITGPSQVMWTVDDEIRDELAAMGRQDTLDPDRLLAVLGRVEEMVYKEDNILLPLCAGRFTSQEWLGIYRDSLDYGECLGVDPAWPEGDERLGVAARPAAGVGAAPGASGLTITMPGGALTIEQLVAMLNTIPAEITFVDADDINRYFNEGPKDFKRPSMALGREVFSCHPPKVEQVVHGIIDSFRSGRRDSVSRWVSKNGKDLYVSYLAVRDREGNYLGTLELVQDLSFARDHFLRA